MTNMISTLKTAARLAERPTNAKLIFQSLAAVAFLAAPCISRATVTDFTTWTLAQDPPNANFTGSAAVAQATLNAVGGPVPSGTDIGYQSVNGATVGASTSGYAFDSASDFAIAIGFNLSFGTPVGLMAIGFGIGKDGAGADSAGVAMATFNGVPQLFFLGAARDGDFDQGTQFTNVGATLTGSLFAIYAAASGDVTVGASQTAGAAAPTGTTATYAGIENNWASGDLLASFFLRSQGWTSGTSQAVFSNFRVLAGTPTAVPEPGSAGLVCFGGLLFLRRVRQGRRPLK